MTRKLVAALAAMAAIGIATPSQAQKSADTVRLAVTSPLQSLDQYYFPQREWDLFYNSIYEALISWNDEKKDFAPSIAKSWKRVDEVTIDFTIRDDVRFHNGDKLTADDVVTTLSFAGDPKFNFFNKQKFSWIKAVEKTGPDTVRIVAMQPTAMDMMSLITAQIYHGATFAKLEDRSQYGRLSPIGTGAYKIVQFDKNLGAVAIRTDDARHVGRGNTKPIGKIHGLPIPDRDVQIAHLLINSVDAIRDPSVDEMNNLTKRSELAATAQPSYSYLIVQVDSLNRSGQKELLDVRVRRALLMSINRKGILDNMVAGKEASQLSDAICLRVYRACDYSTKPPAYDPEGAKKLLAEAGYPNGFDLEITSLDVSKNYATAIAGDLHRIGIRATVQPANVVLFRKLRSDGKLAVYVGERPVPIPDAGAMMDLFFAAESMDYWRDPILLNTLNAGGAEHDNAKRTAIFKTAIDRINEQSYMMPVATLPTVFVHTKDLKIATGWQTVISDFGWK